jgi:hypothetical protein
MTVWLGEQVHAAQVETDVVFLDIASDAYFCLVGARDHLRLGPGRQVQARPPRAVEDLIAAGLLTAAPSGVFDRSPPAVARGLEGETKAVTLRAFLDAIAANLRAAQAIAKLPFSAVLALAGPLGPSAFEPPDASFLAEAGRFDRLSPWLPRAGLCLMRSLQQRLYLQRRGHHAAWVFGVRTWPFEAHCWLQAGSVVLDDRPDHVTGFAPILVV